MEELLIKRATLTAIGDAIRRKTGETALIQPGDMPDEIDSIPSGGSILLSSISVTTPPTKTEYAPGDSFDPTGMVITAVYTNSASRSITGYTVSPQTLSYSDIAVTISFTEDGTTKTVTQAIQVLDPIVLPQKGDLITMSLGNTGGVDLGLGTNTYRVLDINGTNALCMAMFEAGYSPVNAYSTEVTFSNGINGQKYQDGDLDSFFSSWYNSLNADAKAAINLTAIEQDMWNTGTDGTPHYTIQSSVGPYTFCNKQGVSPIGGRRVFALSVSEVFEYLRSMFGAALTNHHFWTTFYGEDVQPSGVKNSTPWLRTASGGDSSSVFYIYSSYGMFGSVLGELEYACRPAFSIDLRKIEWSMHEIISE